MEGTVGTLEVAVKTPSRGPKAKRYTVRQALRKLRTGFKHVAIRFANGNWELKDDLLQDMRLAVIECGNGRTLRYYRQAGVNRAKNTLRNEKMREMGSIEDFDEQENEARLHYRVQREKHDAVLDALDRLTRIR